MLKPVRPRARSHGELPLAVPRQIALDLRPTVDPNSQAVTIQGLDDPVVNVVRRQIAVRHDELPELQSRIAQAPLPNGIQVPEVHSSSAVGELGGDWHLPRKLPLPAI